jgi:hypothetical protein
VAQVTCAQRSRWDKRAPHGLAGVIRRRGVSLSSSTAQGGIGARLGAHLLTQTLVPDPAGVLRERMALGKSCTGVQGSCVDTGECV